jgi:hypothetical protein
MSRIATTFRGSPVQSGRSLRGFDSVVNDYGTFIGGHPWDFIGTYRTRKSHGSATLLLEVFFNRLRKSITCPIAWLAVLERCTSGLGLPAGALHWHFVMAAPPQHRQALGRNAATLWSDHYGNAKVEAFDPQLNGSFYISKLAAGGDFDFYGDNLDRLPYNGPSDIFAHAQSQPYVPDHVRHLTRYRTLALR